MAINNVCRRMGVSCFMYEYEVLLMNFLVIILCAVFVN